MHAYIHTCWHTYVNTEMYTFICTQIRTCIDICAYVILTCIQYIYTYLLINTCILRYIHA